MITVGWDWKKIATEPADVLDNVSPMLVIGLVTFSTAVIFVQHRLQ